MMITSSVSFQLSFQPAMIFHFFFELLSIIVLLLLILGHFYHFTILFLKHFELHVLYEGCYINLTLLSNIGENTFTLFIPLFYGYDTKDSTFRVL